MNDVANFFFGEPVDAMMHVYARASIATLLSLQMLHGRDCAVTQDTERVCALIVLGECRDATRNAKGGRMLSKSRMEGNKISCFPRAAKRSAPPTLHIMYIE